MAQKVILKAAGLYTDPNQLSSIPEGSLTVADNVFIDRDNVIEPRRGFAQYGQPFGLEEDRSKQLLVYKNRLLLHYNDKLLFNANPHDNASDGNFQQFDGSYTELETGRRIRGFESNKNFYFTTNDGIKKISAKTADDFTTAAGFITDAGGVKALDLTVDLVSGIDGFLPGNSKVAYRIVWGYKDANDNVVLGTPSSRYVLTNFSTSSANANLRFAIPQAVLSNYFYQIYRTATFTAEGGLTLDQIDPGDEMQLVIEDFPTAAELAAGLIEIEDLSPEDFRQGGLPLYTNPNSGDGIDSANEPPPKAKDITMYQSTLFYANTETRARTTISLLGTETLVSGASAITIDDGINPPRTYTFVGEKEQTEIDFSSYAGVIPNDLDGTYWLLNSSSNVRKYYIWYDTTKTKQTLDFTNFVYTSLLDDLKEKYIRLYTKDADRGYYIWFSTSVNDIDPGTNAQNLLTGLYSIKIDISGAVTILDVVTEIRNTVAQIDDLVQDDFDIALGANGVSAAFGSPDTTITSPDHNLETGDSVLISNSTTSPNINGSHVVTVIDKDTFTVAAATVGSGTLDWIPDNDYVKIFSESFDDTDIVGQENVQSGFVYSILTPQNQDPANDLITNTDVAGRTAIRVNVSRNIATNIQLADATAAAILDQDLAADFDIVYNNGDDFFQITNTNNGNTDDAVDGGFVPVGNGFAITILQQGDGNAVSGVITATTTGASITVTSLNNNLNIGDIISITGSNTTPSIDGSHTVTGVTSSTFDITPALPVTIAGTSGTWKQTDNEVLLSIAASSAQAIDETARSLVNIINQDASSSVNAFYVSGPNDLPGQILLEVKDIGTNQFTVVANDSTTGELFNPSLPPVANAQEVKGEAEIKPNRIYFAKTQQPEAVPLLNFIDIGREDKEIHRIVALRESLFILKEDGVYRLTGSNGNFAVDLFDESTQILSPDSAVVVNNQIYCFTNQGIVMISDTGVSVISKQIDNIIKRIIGSDIDYKFTTFGVAYETDRSYLLFLPTTSLDTVATQCLRYSTSTNGYTRYVLSKTCGTVVLSNNKLYLGASDVNFIEQERKNFNRTDFADRDYPLIIPTDAIEDTELTLSSSQLVDVGDAIVQTQYLTINEFNQLLAKLDLDPGTGLPEITQIDFSSYSGTIPDDLHNKYFFIYSAGDVQKYAVVYDAVGDVPSLDPIVYTDLADAQQIRVDVSSAITKEDLALLTKSALATGTLDFVTTHVSGNEFLTTTTTRNGATTDAFDSGSNSIGNGFAITVIQQGIGDYVNSLQAVPGDNMLLKITDLAQELDADPGIAQNDFLSAISNYSDTGATISAGDPTVITSIAHGLQTGRLVTISNSTSTPSINGTGVITKIDDDNFSIDISTSVGGTCDWSAQVNTFEEIQAAFNTMIIKLNNDDNVFYQNYYQSIGTKEFEVLIIGKANNTTDIQMQFPTKLIEGPVTLYKGINVKVQYAPDPIGDPSTMKHVSQGTYIFEDTNFSRATVAYSTDLSPGFEQINFTKSGKGDFGLFIWDQHNWGGGFSGVPLRTFIPRQKQKCLYIRSQFIHNSAREAFALYGISYSFRPISERGYRS